MSGKCLVMNGTSISHLLPKAQGPSQAKKKNIVRTRGCWGQERSNVFWAWQDGCIHDLTAGHGRTAALVTSQQLSAQGLHKMKPVSFLVQVKWGKEFTGSTLTESYWQLLASGEESPSLIFHSPFYYELKQFESLTRNQADSIGKLFCSAYKTISHTIFLPL